MIDPFWISITLICIIVTYIATRKSQFRQLVIINCFLLMQLHLMSRQKKAIRYKLDDNARHKLALLAYEVKFNEKYCLAFSRAAFIRWYRRLVHKNISFVQTRPSTGRKPIPDWVKKAVFEMKLATGWGYSKIAGEITKIGHRLSKTSVRNILKHYPSPNPNSRGRWKRLLKDKINQIIACDFKVVQNQLGQQFYIFFCISHISREIVHFNITRNPNRNWLLQQFREVTDGSERKILIHDNDPLFKPIDFEHFNIQSINIRRYAPNMNAICERFIGSFKREALSHYDRCFTEKKLREITREYIHYYNTLRPHQGIGNLTIPNYKQLLVGKYSPPRMQYNHGLELTHTTFLDGHINSYYWQDKKVA
jgi:putative transposase